MRRPAPSALADIRHPGPAAADRRPFALCDAIPIAVPVPAGTPLLTNLGAWAAASGFSSAVLDLSGLPLSAFDYVMPDRAIDDRHAAWYSDTHHSAAAVLEEAVAILGWKDGSWFAHIHGFWQDGNKQRLGHLLPHTLTATQDITVSGWGLRGARFEAELDPETEFTLFRTRTEDSASPRPTHNALITTLAPFEDLSTSIESLAATLGPGPYCVYGLGSLAGARFTDSAPMTGLISEILLRPGAGAEKGTPPAVPVRCADLTGALFEGILVPGGAPTLVTCELLIVRENG